LFPVEASRPANGSLLHHVTVRGGYEAIALRLLGGVVVGRDVTQDGVYRERGLYRAGADPRAALDARKIELRAEISRLESSTRDAAAARTTVAGLRARASGAAQPDEINRLLQAARAAEAGAAEEAAALEEQAITAEAHAATLAQELEVRSREAAERNAVRHQRELDRSRSADRIESLRRQAALVGDDVTRLEAGSEERSRHVAESEEALAKALKVVPELRAARDAAEVALQSAEHDAPDDEAELAESAKRLVAVEEARIDARLRTGNLEGNLELIAREAELLQARMDEIRSRMPDGVAPEEIPGGKAREKEMRALERRLEEIGPTNALAESEFRELEERYKNMAEQLDDITSARTDLEDLITKLREEEDSRYEAVFGAVAANFHEYFNQLNPGGRATLRHADGDDGPRSGVEILVQPPRKRLQNVTLLSSGERSLAALALVLALDEVNPSPFTILDEVDAALDDANVDRFGQMVARMGEKRQFLVITHNHVTMSYASTLYGIHLDESGSSHLVSVRLDDIRKPASATAAQAG
jgi:chromosome segregation protein